MSDFIVTVNGKECEPVSAKDLEYPLDGLRQSNSTIFETTPEAALMDLYKALHVSQIKDQPSAVRMAWKVGQMLYNDMLKEVKEGM